MLVTDHHIASLVLFRFSTAIGIAKSNADSFLSPGGFLNRPIDIGRD
jgi:hypothetical protein